MSRKTPQKSEYALFKIKQVTGMYVIMLSTPITKHTLNGFHLIPVRLIIVENTKY